MYDEDDLLQISGLMHFKFCRRRWALIHIENEWSENFLTADGRVMHDNAHDPTFRETRVNVVTVRGMYVRSLTLGVSGQCDAVEFRSTDNGVPLAGREGKWLPYPVEYKRGKPNEHGSDELQLCCQAMCLEEMLCCEVAEGALYYGEPRRRTSVQFTPDIRDEVKTLLSEMHMLYKKGYTPKVRPTKACRSCSLKDICLPELMEYKDVRRYMLDEAGV